MTSGLKTEDLEIGTGPEAARQNTVLANVRFFLNRGEEVSPWEGGPRMVIHLFRRSHIPGLSRGIVGMRAGGRRRLTIAPHLAFGETGVPGVVPPSAVIRCEVELLEVRQPWESHPDDPGNQPWSRHLEVVHPGEVSRRQVRWKFGLQEDGSYAAGIMYPAPGMTWKHLRSSWINGRLDPETAAAFFDSAQDVCRNFPDECLVDGLWMDPTERHNIMTRSPEGSPCICVSIIEWPPGTSRIYYLRETSSLLPTIAFYTAIVNLIQPHLEAAQQWVDEYREPGTSLPLGRRSLPG